jgi:hypothetical protein
MKLSSAIGRVLLLAGPSVAMLAVAPPASAQQRPLTIDAGQARQVKAGDRLVLPGAGGQLADIGIKAASNTVLQALPSTLQSVTREGYATKGDAPALTFIASNSACSLNAGAGDTGSQVPTSDGKCWIAQFGDEADIRQWGLQPGGQADTAMNRAVAYACSTHTPITIPYPGNNPYLLNSSIVIGNGSATQLSTCNGVTIKVARPFNESTSGTTPPNYMVFRWNGTGSSTIPIVAKGPASQISLHGVSVNCANTPGNHCATGIQINNIIEGRFSELGVAGNVGPGFSIISTPINTWPGALEGSQFNDLSAANPGTGGSGMDIGVTNCVGCTGSTLNAAVIADIFNNVTLNFDGATAGTYGLQLGLVTQSTFTNMRIACSSGSISGDCSSALGNAIKVTPVTNRTMFPTDLTFIHPLINGTVTDPGASWTGDQGITFINWSLAYRGFPTSTNVDLFKGTDSRGRYYPGAQNWTPTDGSGAGLSFTVADATYSLNGNTCSVSLALTFPSTANANTISIGGLPTRCRPISGSGTARAGGPISYTNYATAPITALMDTAGQVGLYTFSGAALTNANMSGKILRVSFNFPTH